MGDRDSDSDSDSDIAAFDPNLFAEPAGFRPASPEETVTVYEREAACVQPGTPSELTLHMIGGRHSLWAHRIWNAGVVLARHVDRGVVATRSRRVLELGCAAGLPSLVAALNGAEAVVASDYPDPALLAAITRTCARLPLDSRPAVVGLQWGQADHLAAAFAALPDASRKFDVVFLADLIFNHSEHRNLLKTCLAALEPSPASTIYVYFTSHVVKWVDRDMNFFNIAAESEFGFKFVEFDQVKASAMFPDDVGDLGVRETVHCYRLWKEVWKAKIYICSIDSVIRNSRMLGSGSLIPMMLVFGAITLFLYYSQTLSSESVGCFKALQSANDALGAANVAESVPVRFEGHKVWRVAIESETDLARINTLHEQVPTLDYWTDPRIGSHGVDIRVSAAKGAQEALAAYLEKFKISHVEIIPDVQEAIEDQLRD
ncbi:nicotinamide n-methyltransferase, partial [Physocladia obscura]